MRFHTRCTNATAFKKSEGILCNTMLFSLTGIVSISGCASPEEQMWQKQPRAMVSRAVEIHDETDKFTKQRVISSASKIMARYANGYRHEYVAARSYAVSNTSAAGAARLSSHAFLKPGQSVRYVLSFRHIDAVDLSVIDWEVACRQLMMLADGKRINLPMTDTGVSTYDTSIRNYWYSKRLGVNYQDEKRYLLDVAYQVTPTQMRQLATARKIEYRACDVDDQIATSDEIKGIAEVYRRSLDRQPSAN